VTNAGPPDDELTALFGEERAQHVFSDQLRVSVLRGVERAILLAPAVIVGVGAAAAVGSAGAAASKAWTTKVVITIAALSFGVGTAAGVVGTKVLTPRPRAAPIAVTSATAVRTAELPLAPAPPNSEPAPEPATPPPPTAPSARPPATPASAHGAEASPSTLARESEIIEKGRTALARGRAADALAAVDEHKRLFPRGRLGEERDELAIRALRFAGRSDEANARAKEFAKTYPSSIYLGTIEAPER